MKNSASSSIGEGRKGKQQVTHEHFICETNCVLCHPANMRAQVRACPFRPSSEGACPGFRCASGDTCIHRVRQVSHPAGAMFGPQTVSDARLEKASALVSGAQC
eukprot:7193557-Pyramimonas_sp.AAC.1